MRERRALVAFVAVIAAVLAASPAAAAPAPIPAALQLRGHLPELGARSSLRLFQTGPAYESFRASLGGANVFPPASSLFMSFDKDILALYARGDDFGGRCLRTGTAMVDGDTATLDLLWESGTCGAPSSARHPFVLVSLSRTTSGGSAWVQSTRSVCGSPPGGDARACAPLTGGAAASPSPTPAPTAPATTAPATTAPATTSPAATTPSPAPTPSPSPAPGTPLPTAAAPTVSFGSPASARSPEPARSIDMPSDDPVNVLLWAALGLIVAFVVVAGVLARSPRR